MKFNATAVLAALLGLAAAGCGDDKIIHSAMGVLKVTVINAGTTATKVELTLRCTTDSRDEAQPVGNPDTLMKVDDLAPGTCQARVLTRAPSSKALRTIWVSDLLIAAGKTTEITVDMGDGFVPTGELCNGVDDDGDGLTDEPPDHLPLCTECLRAMDSLVADDPRCPAIGCLQYASFELRGNETNGFTCVKHYNQDVTSRCEAINKCFEPSEAICKARGTKMEDVALTLEATDVCHRVEGCSGRTAGALANQPDGTPCGAAKVCVAGVCQCKPVCDGKVCGDDGCGGSCGTCKANEACSALGTCACVPSCTGKVCGDDGCGGSCGTCKATETCSANGKCDCAPSCAGKACGDDGCGGSCGACKVTEACSAAFTCDPLAPDQGCADGTREGFQALAEYPTIASCSGAWAVGGVTRADLVPTCARKSGNNGLQQDGAGCSAADLCAAGWHVCKGKTEVAAKAGVKGCLDSVPSGSPEKAMFFAVSQNSEANSVCDDASTKANDVFGCGNLGIKLAADKSCGVLTRALASMTPQSCGYTEAEPALGPWECKGGADSHLQEGALVTKKGCPNQSCNWDGNPTGNWDRGGVLCCKD